MLRRTIYLSVTSLALALSAACSDTPVPGGGVQLRTDHSQTVAELWKGLEDQRQRNRERHNQEDQEQRDQERYQERLDQERRDQKRYQERLDQERRDRERY